MKPVGAVLATVVILFLQLVAVPHMAIAGISPNLLIVLLAALVLGRGPIAAVIIGALIGFLGDLGNAAYLGLGVIGYSIVAFGLARIGVLLPENAGYRGFVVFVSSLVLDLLSLAVTTSFSLSAMLSSFFRISIGSALYSALVAAALFSIFGLRSLVGVGRFGRS